MPLPPAHRRALPALALAAALSIPLPARSADIVDPAQGPVALDPGTTGASELSGIVYAGGERVYAVSDGGGRLFPIDATIDPQSGFVTAASVAPALVLAGGVDLEGVAAATDAAVWVSDEIGSAIRRHRLSDGGLAGSLAVPAIFQQIRSNLGLESLSGVDGVLWTANEEALVVDGDVASAGGGTVVRLQRFDAAGAPAGQWAYVTDPVPGAPILNRVASGVVDLLALPGGELLVLERALSNQGLRARIHQVDFADASDTSGLAGLAETPFTPVSKRLLWERNAGFDQNYEGLALGPSLDAGDRSLLLISDDGGSGTSYLYPLRLRPAPRAQPVASSPPWGMGVLALSLAATSALPAGPRSRVRRPRL